MNRTPHVDDVDGAGGRDAPPDALDRITDAITAGKLTVPIAATFPIEQIRDAATLQRGGHVHGKVEVKLSRRQFVDQAIQTVHEAVC